ncbi:hypothetical protein C8J57DRAFT_1237020 [Mycena rebaudengoi]|nr:hypothetical protein C8J57DRAFT_1237020 [Mycena rebaudengoi]
MTTLRETDPLYEVKPSDGISIFLRLITEKKIAHNSDVLDEIAYDEGRARAPERAPLAPALGTLVTTALAIQNFATSRFTADISGLCLVLLLTDTTIPRLLDAFIARLLRALISSSTPATSEARRARLLYHLRNTLPYLTVFSAALSEPHLALEKVEDLAKHDAFLESPLFEAWGKFRTIVTQNLNLFQLVDSAQYGPLKGCDNFEV